MIELTKNEADIILILRELKPFESVSVQKDKNGVVDSYLITRTQKIILSSSP